MSAPQNVGVGCELSVNPFFQAMNLARGTQAINEIQTNQSEM